MKEGEEGIWKCVCVDKWQCFGQNVKSFDVGVKPNRTGDRVKCEYGTTLESID